jgi:tellurite resistance-related uncharacterized protein
MEELTMYDAIDVGAIPAGAAAVAGYVGGHWPTYPQLLTKFPDAHHVSIAVNSGEDAHVLDIETGDAKPADAPAWVLRQQQRGLKRPGLYCSLSVMQGVVDVLETHDVQRKSVVLWCAHYTGTPHICGPQCGDGLKETVDATQYKETSSVDESLVTPAFWPAP